MAKAGLLFVGTSDGMVLYSEPGGMGRWLRIGHELRGRSIRSIWVCDTNPLIVVAADETELLRSSNGGNSWEAIAGVPSMRLHGSKGLARITGIDPQGAVWQSEDAGEAWTAIGRIASTITAIASRSENPSELFAAGTTQIWQSHDSGATWATYGPAFAEPISALACLSANLGTHVLVLSAGLLWEGDGNGWQQRPTPNNAAQALTIFPGREPALAIAQATGGVWRSTDRGGEWQPSEASFDWDQEPSVFAPAPYHVDTAFVGNGAVVAISTDRGRTWQRLKNDSKSVQAIASARLV
jgi:photosystem II stability/assembly factor-like uncharacterized protein